MLAAKMTQWEDPRLKKLGGPVSVVRIFNL